MDGKRSDYRWIMAALMWIMLFTLGMSWYSFAPMMLTVMGDLSITFEEAGILIALVPLAMVMLCIPSGLLADPFGFKRTILIGGTILSTFGLARGFSENFTTLAITMFLCGAGYAITYSPLPKVIGTWFPATEYGLATGIIFSGMAGGMVVSFILTPTLLLRWTGSWQGIFVAIGVVSFASTTAWIVLAREAPQSTSEAPQRQLPRESLSLWRSFFSSSPRSSICGSPR